MELESANRHNSLHADEAAKEYAVPGIFSNLDHQSRRFPAAALHQELNEMSLESRQAFLDELTPRWREAVELRCGLNGGELCSEEEITEIMGMLHPSAVSRLLKIALNILHAPSACESRKPIVVTLRQELMKMSPEESRAFLDQLNPRRREAVELGCGLINGSPRTPKEAAEKMQVSKAAVSGHLSAALSILSNPDRHDHQSRRFPAAALHQELNEMSLEDKQAFLDKLSLPCREAVELSCGLSDARPHALEEAAERMGMQSSTISSLLVNALDILHDPYYEYCRPPSSNANPAESSLPHRDPDRQRLTANFRLLTESQRQSLMADLSPDEIEILSQYLVAKINKDQIARTISRSYREVGAILDRVIIKMMNCAAS